MSGNRKHGFMRGNANGRKRASWLNSWYCDGCKREHGHQVFKNGLNGLLLCDRQYYKAKGK